MTSRRRFLLALTAIFLPLVPLGRGGDEHADPDVIESFNGKLHLSWKVVRPDKKRHSLTKNKGKLTITTQRGTIYAESDKTNVKAKNLFLVGNPYGRADFEVSVRVSKFEPTATYQQAGLLLYDDDDNYLKFVWEAKTDAGNHLVYIRETEAKPLHSYGATPENKGEVWLRLTRRKNKYEYAASGDGKKWTVYGEEEWKEKAPRRIGLMAKNGPTDAPETDACFDEFRVRALKPKEE